MFRYQILGLLQRGEPLHGYALMKEYNLRTGKDQGAGYFYRQIEELVRAGLLREVQNPPDADPRRTPYVITTDGLQAFRTWLAAPPRIPASDRFDQAARIMFFSEVEPDVAARVLTLWQSKLLERAKRLEGELHAARTHGGERLIRPLLLRRELMRVAGDLAVLEELATSLGLTGAAAQAAASEATSPAATPRKRAGRGSA